jgi:hypothetical protein
MCQVLRYADAFIRLRKGWVLAGMPANVRYASYLRRGRDYAFFFLRDVAEVVGAL